MQCRLDVLSHQCCSGLIAARKATLYPVMSHFLMNGSLELLSVSENFNASHQVILIVLEYDKTLEP